MTEQKEATQSEDTGEPKETEYCHPLLRPALTGDVEGVQQIFADPEDPDGEKAMKLLLEKDIVGRDLLYAICMAGQSAVIRALAKYGVVMTDKTARGYTLLHCAAAWGQLETLKTLVELEADLLATTFHGEKARDIAYRYAQMDCVEFLDWAEAKQALRTFIAHIQATITDPEKVQGRLNKEEKNMSLSACRVKSDWLENAKEPTRQDILDQKQQLEQIMLPIFTKLAIPPLSRQMSLSEEILRQNFCRQSAATHKSQLEKHSSLMEWLDCLATLLTNRYMEAQQPGLPIDLDALSVERRPPPPTPGASTQRFF